MATTYDNASLVMIPSGVKESKLYSIKPSNGDGDFTFSRGTDTATRVNASGLIEKERGNISINSQNGSAWTNSGSTINSTTAADFLGGNDAVTFTANGGGAAYVYADDNISVVSGVIYTGSVYVKNVDADYVQLTFGTSAFGSAQYRNFDLTNGTLGGGLGIDAKIVDVGGGWYRLSITAAATASVSTASLVVIISPSASASRLQAATAGQTLTTFAIQVEQGLVATDYIETTTAAVYEGITDNLPRLDYSGGASCPSLLLEPSRTNAFNHSEYSAAIEYNNVNSITNNAGISPEGVQNALEIDATGNDIADSYRNVGSGVVATFSVFAKAGTADSIRMAHAATGSAAYADFNLTSGTRITTGGAQYLDSDIEDYGNGWYRCWVTFTSGTGAYINRLTLQDTGTYQFYGFQLEAGSYPTSYIPTYGTSASRAGDICLKTGISSLIGQTEGAIFFEYTPADVSVSAAQDTIPLALSIGGTSGNAIFLNDYNGNLTLNVNVGGATQAQIQFGSLVAGQTFKIGIGYASNDLVYYVNGTQIGTDTSLTIPACDEFKINGFTSPIHINNIGVKQALLFKTRLTNAELAALTA